MTDHINRADQVLRTVVAGVILALLMLGCNSKNRPDQRPDSTSDSSRMSGAAQQDTTVPVLRVLSYEERQGEVVYARYCAICHGKEGKGDGFNAFNLDPRPRDFTDSTFLTALSESQINQTITGGGRSVNKSPLMPSYGWTLSSREIRYVTSYIGRFSGGR